MIGGCKELCFSFASILSIFLEEIVVSSVFVGGATGGFGGGEIEGFWGISVESLFSLGDFAKAATGGAGGPVIGGEDRGGFDTGGFDPEGLGGAGGGEGFDASGFVFGGGVIGGRLTFGGIIGEGFTRGFVAVGSCCISVVFSTGAFAWGCIKDLSES